MHAATDFSYTCRLYIMLCMAAHMRMGTNTHMGEVKISRDTCMSVWAILYAYGQYFLTHAGCLYAYRLPIQVSRDIFTSPICVLVPIRI